MKKRMKIITILIALFLAFAGLTVIYSNKAEAANDHNWEKNWHDSTEVKCQQYKKCKDKDCNAIKTKPHHTYGDWEVTTTANCMTEGIQTRTCSVCGNPDIKHTGKDPNTHVWGEWIIDTPATCKENSGKHHRICTNSAHNPAVTETERYKDITNHTGVEKEYKIKNATCLSTPIYQMQMSCCNAPTGNKPSAKIKDLGDGKYQYIIDHENNEEIEKNIKNGKDDVKKYSINLKNHVVDVNNAIRKSSQDKTYYVRGEDGILRKKIAQAYLCDKNKGGCGYIYYVYKIYKIEDESYNQPDPPEDNSSNDEWDKTAHMNWKHNDIYTGLTEFLCQKYSGTSPELTSNSNANKKTVVQKMTNLLLCKYKHGSIRFTPDIKHIPSTDMTEWLYPYTPASVINTLYDKAKGEAETLLEEADYYKPSTNVKGIYKRYVGTWGDVDKSHDEGEWVANESGDGATLYWKKYAMTPTWEKSTQEGKNIENNREAYVLSSGPSFSPTSEKVNFAKGNYAGTTSDEATDQLIQDALWIDREYEKGGITYYRNGFNEGGEYKNNTKAKDLLEEGVAYRSFYKAIHDDDGNDNYKNKVEADTSKANVVVNRNDSNDAKKEYTVGPFYVTYPGGGANERKFSYIENMQVIAKNSVNGKEVALGKGSFEIVTIENGSSTDYYPYSGEKFWIKFNAAIVKQEIGEYPTSIKIDVTFAYLESCSASYDVYKGKGNVRQIVGYLEKVESTEKDNKFYTYTVISYPNAKYNEKGELISKGEEVKTTYKVPYFKYTFHTGTIEAGTYEAQKLAMLTKRQRTWKKYKMTLNKTLDIDLTMELGGQVWEDTNGGKMTENDNVYDKKTDKPMPNVIVTLYRYDDNGQKVKAELSSYKNTSNNKRTQQTQNPTKTDSNGRYLFTGINSMYQYFVEFTYNSQYYEPVEYVSPSDKDNGWVNYEEKKEGTWNINSNGTDVQEERKAINARFASIGSSPANYTVTEENNRTNKTFTKKQLQGYTLNENGEYVKTKEAVIDEFGNLIKEKSNSNTTETNEMIQYVKDCMLNSYTGKDIKQNNKTVRKNDLYPIYPSFVIAESFKDADWATITEKLKLKDNIKYLYKNDANLYINQGYTLRRTSDLALNKDVYKVTLETNGQTHEYTYNKLDKFKCNDCGKTGTNDELGFSEDYGVNICPSCKSKNVQNVWDIDLRLSDIGLIDSEKRYYNTEYTRELYASDYAYKVRMYGDYNELGKSKDDELKVYITYKIGVRNQSQSILCRADEIVDYYDEDLTYVPERSYIQVSNKKYLVNSNTESIYKQAGTRTDINHYKNLYITGLGKNSQEIDNNGNNVGSEAEGLYLTSGKTAYIYLTFEVNKKTENNEDWIILDEDLATGNVIGVGKENIAEINGYSTKYKEGTTIPNVEGDVSGQPAGIVDRDSNPGNLNPTDVPKDGTPNYKNFEDDTDKAPNIKLKIDRNDDHNRVISGTVWEDKREVSGEKVAIGNGLRENSETLIDGVTVQLVELLDDGKEFVWREFGTNQIGNFGTNAIGKGTGSGTVQSETPIIGLSNIVGNVDLGNDHKGKYAFKSFMPGKYVVRFIYGDTVRTVYPSELGGLNSKSYNGQDYKSTTYQKDIPQNKTYEWRRNSTWINGQEQKGDIITKIHAYNTDNCTNNETAIKKQLNDNEQKGYLYDITTADSISLSKKQNASDAKDIESRRNKVIEYSEKNVTNYKAEVLAAHKADYNTMNSREDLIKDLIDNTKMTAETGMMVIEFEYDRTQTDTKDAVQDTSIYKVQNVDLGLEERPKAQLEINKEVTNVKLTLADGSTLFDAKQTASNVLWKDHKKYDTGYKNNMLDETKFGSIANIRAKNTKDSRLGLIQLSMDEELMHGAKIQITYQITVTNVGEVDYKDNQFYYTGTVADKNTIVKTTANQIIDYVANNLQFDSSLAENTDWEVITQDKLITQDKAQDLVNKNLKAKVEQYNTIITTKENATIAKTELVPDLYDNTKSSVSTNLVLTQLITAENKTDDLTYKNIVEIVKTSNNVGRRNEYSVVGNQDPTMEPQEIDSDRAEIVKILPPFGNAGLYIIITITTIIAIGLLAGGIVFIRRKILKK